jgi:hypothetical protein
MRIARYAALISMGCFSWFGAQAQLNCTGSTKLACLVPFTTNAQAQASQATIFNGPIGVQISQLPVAASATGAGYLFVNGNPQPFDNLGSILLDRPDSVGKKRFVLGFSFQTFNFNHLDGIGIGSIPFVFSHPVLSADGTSVTQTNYFEQNVHVSIKYNQYVALATYGLLKNTDVSVVVPFARVSAGAFNLQSLEYQVTSSNVVSSAFPVTPQHGAGSADGVGDVLVNVKQVLWRGGESGRVSLATGTTLRFPTGDALNYLGSGAYGFNLYGLASYKRRISPHAKLAYQWNTNSVLLSSSGGSQLPGSFVGSTGSQRLPGGVQYAVGVDVGATKALTLSADVLASEFVNSPNITVGQQEIPATSVGPTNVTACPTVATTTPPPACYLSTIAISRSTYTTANLSVGLKLKPFRHANLILYGNGLFQLNDVGLRSDPSPSAGISYTFRH